MRVKFENFSYEQNLANFSQRLSIDIILDPELDDEYFSPMDLNAIKQMIAGTIKYFNYDHKFSVESEGKLMYEHSTIEPISTSTDGSSEDA